MRVKNRWRKGKGPKTIEDQSNALGFIVWQISSNALLELENKQYQTDSNSHRLDVIEEFACFLIQCTDRLAYERMDDEKRQTFINTIAIKVAKTLQENRLDVQGAEDFVNPFIEKLNARFSTYSECQFADDEPGYSLYRALGNFVQPIMGERNNRWVSDQVLDIEGPDAFDVLKKSMDNLLNDGDLF